jgi:methenyltetrahydrofolate cyclohydrolase
VSEGGDAAISGQPLERFLDALASAAPTPGGGSAAAIIGAMGAALTSMVCNLTLGKKDYEAVQQPIREALGKTETLRTALTRMISDDVRAFDTLMAAYRLPRSHDEEKRVRSEAIQSALKQATDVPLACAQACLEVIELAREVAMIGNRGVISDSGVSTLAAYAALRSAALNVDINVPSIKDEAFVRLRRERQVSLLQRGHAASEETMQIVRTRLAQA